MRHPWLATICATLLLTATSWYFLNHNKLSTADIQQQFQTAQVYASRIIGSSIDIPNKDYKTTPPTTTVSYDDAQKQIDHDREALAKAYQNAANSVEKQDLLEQSRRKFVESATTLLPYWYGTPWDFYGTSTTPQQGKIACGYYVTTVLEDSGLAIERSKLAQQASENIIKSLTGEANIRRFSNRPFNEFIDEVKAMGAGLYIVGLDFHVGYLWHDGEQLHFIHSTSYPYRGVIKEPASSSHNLKNSKYRVVGKISDDDALIEKWLLQTSISTQTG